MFVLAPKIVGHHNKVIHHTMNSTLIPNLKELYIKEDGNDEFFDQEIGIIQEFLTVFEKQVSSQYELIEPIGRGGNGIVIKVRNVQLNLYRALKFPRPIKLELIESVKSDKFSNNFYGYWNNASLLRFLYKKRRFKRYPLVRL